MKDYINNNKNLVPAKRQLVAPRGNRGRRYETEPGESFYRNDTRLYLYGHSKVRFN